MKITEQLSLNRVTHDYTIVSNSSPKRNDVTIFFTTLARHWSFTTSILHATDPLEEDRSQQCGEERSRKAMEEDTGLR